MHKSLFKSISFTEVEGKCFECKQTWRGDEWADVNGAGSLVIDIWNYGCRNFDGVLDSQG